MSYAVQVMVVDKNLERVFLVIGLKPMVVMR